jgi:hypothetical protein
MKTILGIVNVIYSGTKIHRQFKNFLEEMNLKGKLNDILCYLKKLTFPPQGSQIRPKLQELYVSY